MAVELWGRPCAFSFPCFSRFFRARARARARARFRSLLIFTVREQGTKPGTGTGTKEPGYVLRKSTGHALSDRIHNIH